MLICAESPPFLRVASHGYNAGPRAVSLALKSVEAVSDSVVAHVLLSRAGRSHPALAVALREEHTNGGQIMAEQDAVSQSSILEQWIEHEFEQALGGEHIIEQLRRDLH